MGIEKTIIMNREMKFRAWDIKRNEMVDWNGIIGHGSTMYKILCFPEPDYNLMQFTGLHDKNGVEIYEGDVVKIDNNHETAKGTEFYSFEDVSHHKVIWYNERACFWDVRLEDGDCGAAYADGDISFLKDGIIIGNIHENPELIIQ